MPEESDLRLENGEDQEESSLSKEKLRLEIDALRHSKKYGLEAIKAAAAPIAIVGFTVTLIVGILQSNTTTRAQEDTRFDQAIARLGSTDPTQKLTGIAGLELFLEPHQRARHHATLRYLANALASEHDPTVQGAILDVISDLHSDKIGQADLNDVLERLRDRNRSLYSQAVAKCTQECLNHSNETHVSALSDEERRPLEGTAFAIAALIRNGARTRDLSGIYCANCDFSGKSVDEEDPDYEQTINFAALKPSESVDISETSFQSAILRNANFVGVTLSDGNLDGADLVNADFSGADLRRAKITDYHKFQFLMGSLGSGQELAGRFPTFLCANLSDADFTGSIFFAIYSWSTGVGSGAYPLLEGANLSGAKLDKTVLITFRKSRQRSRPSVMTFPSQDIFDGTGGGGSYTLIKGDQDVVLEYDKVWTDPDLRFKEVIPSDYWNSTRDVFSNLNSAKNVDLAHLPIALRDFLVRRRSSLSQPDPHVPCTTRE